MQSQRDAHLQGIGMYTNKRGGHIEEGVLIVYLSINLRLVFHNTSNKKISGI